MSSLIFRRTCTRVALRFYCALPYAPPAGVWNAVAGFVFVLHKATASLCALPLSLSLVVSSRVVRTGRKTQWRAMWPPFRQMLSINAFYFQASAATLQKAAGGEHRANAVANLKKLQVGVTPSFFLVLFSCSLYIRVCIAVCVC